jgi:general secretion pathway protein D
LFRNNSIVDDKINLVIIITPYIIPKSKDLTYIRDQLVKLKILEDKYKDNAIKRINQIKE